MGVGIFVLSMTVGPTPPPTFDPPPGAPRVEVLLSARAGAHVFGQIAPLKPSFVLLGRWTVAPGIVAVVNTVSVKLVTRLQPLQGAELVPGSGCL